MRHLCVILQGQFINDKQVLMKAADEAGVSGAEELLNDEDELKSEVLSGVVRLHGLKDPPQVACCVLHDT